jgi:type III secretion system YscI/HrpB-like protein
MSKTINADFNNYITPSATLGGNAKEPEIYDVEWFNSMVKSSADEPTFGKPPGSGDVSSRVLSNFINSSDRLQDLSDKLSKDLLKATKTSDPKALIEANRSLSSFYLESLLTTKLVSKGTQAVEKLTSLQ